MKIKLPTATLPPEKYRSVELAGDVAQQLALYHQAMNKEAKKNGNTADISLGYVVKEMLREACKADPERQRVKPRPGATRLRNIEVEGDVALAIRQYTTRLGLEEPDYVIESLLKLFLRGDRRFQQLVRDMEASGDDERPAGNDPSSARTLAAGAPRTPATP